MEDHEHTPGGRRADGEFCAFFFFFFASHGVHKLVHEPLRDVGLADDTLLVVLADGAAQLVVVHGRPVLPQTPQTCHVG